MKTCKLKHGAEANADSGVWNLRHGTSPYNDDASLYSCLDLLINAFYVLWTSNVRGFTFA